MDASRKENEKIDALRKLEEKNKKKEKEEKENDALRKLEKLNKQN